MRRGGATEDESPRSHALDVCGVVVTYHPDAEFSSRLERLSRQVGRVIVVDNGSTGSELRMLSELSTDPSVELVINGENRGVAQALNEGIRRAASRGYAYALLLDQDTQVDEGMVAALLAVYASFPDRAGLAVIGSHYVGASAIEIKSPDGRKAEAAQCDEVEAVITSGSLLPLAAYKVIGPFREEFFIDYVDIDYCVRARAKGYRVVKTKKALMSHVIGSPTRHEWLGLKKSTTNHSADRRYYIARNNTVMLRESGNYFAGGWAVKSLFRCLRQCRRILLHEGSKAEKIIAVAHGWWDGILGRMGPRRPPGRKDVPSAAGPR
jgi:rhamnosyltransferase